VPYLLVSARKPCQFSGTRKFFDFMNSRTTILGPSVEYCVCVCVRERERERAREREERVSILDFRLDKTPGPLL